jgi:hypothetical protein
LSGNILPDIVDSLEVRIMCKISYKIVENESCQNFANIFMPIWQVFFKQLAQNEFKNVSYQTRLMKSNKNVKSASHKYL